MITGSPTTLTVVKLHEEVSPGAQCVFIRGPQLRLANVMGGGPPPPPAERDPAAQDGYRAETELQYIQGINDTTH